jgi:hypothetical protein
MNNQLVLKIFLFFFFVIPGFSGITFFASGQSSVDSTQVLVRQPDKSFIESYKSQKEFIYSIPPIETNIFKELMEYLWKKFKGWNLFFKSLPFLFKVLMWGSVLFLLFIIISKTRLYKVFYSDREIEAPDYNFSNTENQITDFDSAIRSQIEQRQYRMATRLHYLKVIGMLRNKEFIRYSNDKTNVDFLRDLTNENLKSGFSILTLIFNHVWYGELEITEDQFLRFEKSFHSFYSALDVQE